LGDGRAGAHQAAFDFNAQHGRILRIAPPATRGEADLRSGLLGEMGEGGVR